MKKNVKIRSFWPGVIIVFTVTNLLTLLITLQFYIRYERFYKTKLTFLETLAYTLPDWYLWMALGPVVYWLAVKFPVSRQKWKTHIPVHLFGTVVITLFQNILVMTFNLIIETSKGETLDFWRAFEYNLLTYFHWNLILYWGIVAASYSVNYYKKYQETEIRSAQLSAQLSQARLQALRMQLQPHFLFNTLNTISYYTYVDPKISNRMVQLLSELLRMVLEQNQNERIPLRKEIEFLRQYLEIETFRFQDKLSVQWNVDENALDGLVPCLILQPAVENAMRHGISRLPSSAVLKIGAHCNGPFLNLTISDNGPGIPQLDNHTFREGIGLSNTRSRLSHLYGENHTLRLINQKPAGLEIEIIIPYQVEKVLQA